MTANLDDWFDMLADLPDMPNVHNLYSRHTSEGRVRLQNLRRYFECVMSQNPDTLLIAEAPGYQGTYRTGLPFCSESVMLGPINKFGLFGGADNGYERVYAGDRIWKEPSATIVQRVTDELPRLPVIWATFPLHPHKPGVELSNRAPTAAEVKVGAEVLRALIAAMQPARIVAVGNVAAACLAGMGIDVAKVRHPSHGGAAQFRQQLLALMNANLG